MIILSEAEGPLVSLAAFSYLLFVSGGGSNQPSLAPLGGPEL